MEGNTVIFIDENTLTEEERTVETEDDEQDEGI